MNQEKIDYFLQNSSLNILITFKEELKKIKDNISNEETFHIIASIISIITLVMGEGLLGEDCPINEKISFINYIHERTINVIKLK